MFWLLASTGYAAEPADPSPTHLFGVRVIDAQTGRGVPLVELRTVHEVSYWTDSAGWAAIDDPELMNREVYFHVRSHGYSLPADGFGFRGVRLWVRPGGRATLRLERRNIAERMYRITGAGVYRDSILLGEPAPAQTPLVRADVAGQDSVQAAVYQGKIYWFWGDTNRLAYPLGNFRTTGAVSPLPGQAVFDPNVGVPLQYFTGPDGRCKNLCPFEPKEGVIWIDGVVVVPDPKEGEKLVAHYARMKSLEEMLEHGLAIWDDQKQEFRLWVRLPRETTDRTLLGHPFRYRETSGSSRSDDPTESDASQKSQTICLSPPRERPASEGGRVRGAPTPGPPRERPAEPKAKSGEGVFSPSAGSADSEAKQQNEKPPSSRNEGEEYIYCGLAFPNIRVRASLEAVADPAQYETWTCLAEQTPADTPTEHAEKSEDKSQSGLQHRLPSVKRDAAGKAVWRWSRSAPPISPALEHRLLRAGLLRPEETYFLPVDVQTGKPVEIHSGSVRWNPWRKRWILIGVQQGGESSFLGEVWYAEAESPIGPWRRAIKILTHDRYSFYNPVHHDFLDQQGGRIIFFEGTYSHTFSGNPTPTPRYDYNQIMYRLDLAEGRLQPAQK